MEWTSVEPLSDSHDLDGFTCGEDDLDSWFHGLARRANVSGTAAVHVCVNPDDGVVAFLALASHQMQAVDLSKGAAGGLTGDVPCTLLARMGLHRELRGQGLGAQLILEALKLAVQASAVVASRLLVVDAKNESLAKWYASMNFHPTIGDPLRLYMKMSTAQAVIESL